MNVHRSPQPAAAGPAPQTQPTTATDAAAPPALLLDTAAVRMILDILGAVSLFAVTSAAAGTRDGALATAGIAAFVLISRALRHRRAADAVAAERPAP
jgi:hypothetical protein